MTQFNASHCFLAVFAAHAVVNCFSQNYSKSSANQEYPEHQSGIKYSLLPLPVVFMGKWRFSGYHVISLTAQYRRDSAIP
jgi:hypothetical protein